ncbi:MAG: hypothetical protein KAS17_09890 [Victivallaceae bacterium]|nr:hypothetical protein [Victivallaceae bacterium]
MRINIDDMIFEMLATMDNNFQGTAKQRFKQAKKLLLESIAETINDNKQEIVKDFNRRNIIK